jgi:transposase
MVLGTPDRFRCGKQVASYLGLIPCEDSSAESWRLGHISKQGNALLRFLGLEAQSHSHSSHERRGRATLSADSSMNHSWVNAHLAEECSK